MPKNCILPRQAEALKKAFRNKKLGFSSLYKAGSSEARKEMLKKYVGEAAPEIAATIEKVFLAPNQKVSAKNWLTKHIGEGKALYVGVTNEQAEKMRKGLNMSDLRKMTPEARLEKLKEFVDEKLAQKLNDKYKSLKKTGKLSHWQERATGSDMLKQEARLKGDLAKLDMLDDMGVLSPSQLEQFMGSFVESKLKVSLTVDQSKDLSKLVKSERDAHDAFMAKGGNAIAANEKELKDFLLAVRDLKEFEQNAMPDSAVKSVNKIISFMRSSILASHRVLKNSWLYQAIPTFERFVTKRLLPATIGSDLNPSFMQTVSAKLSGSKPTAKMSKFIAKQVAMGTRIYHSTGFDISRMDSLDDGYRLFGGEKFDPFFSSKKRKDTKGAKEKIGWYANAYARVVNLAPKWFAGGSDMVIANLQRADTAVLMSNERASIEEMKGMLPENVSKEERAEQLLEESYSFNPKDEAAQMIRAMGIFDAHLSNSTQPEGLANKILELRKVMTIKGINFGNVVIPFAKIASTTASIGFKTATGAGVGLALWQIHKSAKLSGVQRMEGMTKGVSQLIRYVGVTGAVVLIASGLDPDDYIPPYASMSYKQYQFSRARGCNPSSLVIAGQCVPMRYFPFVNIPLAAVMQTRQAWERGENGWIAYASGMGSAILDMPGIKDVGELIGKTERLAEGGGLEKTMNALGLDGSSIVEWAKVRFIPSILSYDVYNKIITKKTKYDFLGREIETGGGFKSANTNKILVEFSKLDKEGKMPIIADPSGDYAEKLEARLGSEKYNEKLAELKKNYAKKIEKLMNNSTWEKRSPDNKMKKVNKYRKVYILDVLKKL